MITFRCRTRIPAVSSWVDTSAETPEAAANDYWFNHGGGLAAVSWESKVLITRFRFALVEVEGHGEWVARTVSSGIWRKGGARSSTRMFSIEDVAVKLGWTHEPEDLLDTGWDGEDDGWEKDVNFTTGASTT